MLSGLCPGSFSQPPGMLYDRVEISNGAGFYRRAERLLMA
jgi:hypothetical protein